MIELRSLVGSLARTLTPPLRSVDFARFAAAAGVPWTTEQTSEEAPLLYLTSVLGWGADGELPIDGSAMRDYLPALDLDGFAVMGLGQSIDFLHAARTGDVVTIDTSIVDCDMKRGQAGPWILLKIERAYARGDGEPLLRCLESFAVRPIEKEPH